MVKIFVNELLASQTPLFFLFSHQLLLQTSN